MYLGVEILYHYMCTYQILLGKSNYFLVYSSIISRWEFPEALFAVNAWPVFNFCQSFMFGIIVHCGLICIRSNTFSWVLWPFVLLFVTFMPLTIFHLACLSFSLWFLCEVYVLWMSIFHILVNFIFFYSFNDVFDEQNVFNFM
jgi:hypothetical protein